MNTHTHTHTQHSELIFSKNANREATSLRCGLRRRIAWILARAKMYVRDTLCRAQRTIDFQERPTRVPNTGTRAGPFRFRETARCARGKERDIAVAFVDSAARVSCVCIACTHMYINVPAYRSRTRDFEVALLAVRRWMAIFHRSNP